jgi:hypothetical protein
MVSKPEYVSLVSGNINNFIYPRAVEIRRNYRTVGQKCLINMSLFKVWMILAADDSSQNLNFVLVHISTL